MTGMQGIEDLDHYEMLEISRGASPGEIDRAYRLAQETWADGSLALYSIFEKRDAQAVRARLDEAYRVLADPELRASYDRACGPGADANGVAARQDRGGDDFADLPAPRGPGVVAQAASHGFERAADRSGREGVESAPVEREAPDDGLAGDFDGARLRRTRLFRGYEIDQIADVTKVAGSHLRNIEDENFADLPADVYVRGFVTAYAKTIGLDPVRVVPSYMARLVDSRQKSQKSRFLGLR